MPVYSRPRRRHPVVVIVVAVLLLIAAGAAAMAVLAAAGAQALAPVDPAPAQSFDAAAIERGAQLAAVGDCEGCHTVRGDMPYAGGVPLTTPFGVIHGTNITPDPDTGIGRWSEAAFVRAMRKGLDREGRHLYPAFPYDHFRLVTDDELHALYAYFMTRTPVTAEPPANSIRFPFSMRPLVAAWNVLFLRDEPFVADTGQSAEWNRGAYLVRSLGHCGACHSPRNMLGAEQRDAALSGGEIEGWYAPPINAASPSPLPWSVDQLTRYLRLGLVEQHAIAGGPMKEVVGSLARAAPEDVQAIATYIVATMGPPTPEREARARDSLARAGTSTAALATLAPGPGSATPAADPAPPAIAAGATAQPSAVPPAPGAPASDSARAPATAADLSHDGASIYAGACAGCHEQGRQLSSAGALQLPVAIALHERTPKSLIRIIEDGITPAEGERSRWMPSFAGTLTDDQLAALVTYLRTLAPGASPWTDVAAQVKQARHS